MQGRHASPTEVRQVGRDWYQSSEGEWFAGGLAEPPVWEVFCVECGDTDGPSDIQPEAVQHLRKPRTRIEAEWLALNHERGGV